LFASIKYDFIVLECRLNSPCLNSLCNVLLFELKALAKDLIVDLLCNGILELVIGQLEPFLARILRHSRTDIN
jgi:hypothetical protein